MNLLFLIAFFGCSTGQQSDPLKDLHIKWGLHSNLDPKGSRAEFLFINQGKHRVGPGDWTLYFNQANVMPKARTGNVGRVVHINGDWFKFEPLQGFVIDPGDSLSVEYYYDGPMIKMTDVPMGPYFVRKEDSPEEEIFLADHFEVRAFEREEQIKRSVNDHLPTPTAATRYADNQDVFILPVSGTSRILPSPYFLRMGDKLTRFEGELRIAYANGLEKEAVYLKDRLSESCSNPVVLDPDGQGDIELRTEGHLANDTGGEAYSLSVVPGKVLVTGGGAAGVFYGIQSLLSLQEDAYQGKLLEFPQADIKDAPRFGYRGFHLDVARNFQSKETILKVIDLLAAYKINRLLLYLTEDEGWRLEIQGLPELTEIGAQRQHTKMDSPALHPAYGSGPFAYGEGTHGSGFYSRKDFVEILQYANDRHIQVIPEVNLPGHSRAAIKAMEYRYERLMAEGRPEEAEQYRLIDPEDSSQYVSAQSFTDNVVCVCRESVYDFYEEVVDEIIDIYREAKAPLEYFHTGGDEVPRGSWTGSPMCEALLPQLEGVDNAGQLHSYLIERLAKILDERGLKTAAWEEAVLLDEQGIKKVNPDFPGGQVLPYVWNNLWGAQDLGYRIANAGYPVILCPVTNFYFDLAYDNDPQEPGLYWAGFVDERNNYEFAPYDVFKTTFRNDALYTPLNTEEAYASMERLKESSRKNILGVQAELWSETLKGREMLEYYLLPKLLAFAETAWSPQREWETEEDPLKRKQLADKGWNELANRIGQRELNRLDHLFGGFGYRIPPPGAVIDQGLLHANSAYPGLSIRYTTDGSEPGLGSAVYSSPVPITGDQVKLRAFNASGRSSRTSIVKID